MSRYLYKKFMVSEPLKELPRYVYELIATNDESSEYKCLPDNTFTSNFKLDNNVVKSIINIKDDYRLELRTEKFTPDLDVYITLRRDDIDVDYFLMIKDSILDLEDGFVFASDPVKFLNTIKPTTPEEWNKFEGTDGRIYIDFKGYQMIVNYTAVSNFPDGMKS
jgi:hypothetical protein